MSDAHVLYAVGDSGPESPQVDLEIVVNVLLHDADTGF